jgi:4-amino-4-deoxy-L-arabinose transferase-like glycosyltransferase
VLAFTVAIRFAILFFFADGLRQDPDHYRALADNLSSVGVFGSGNQPTAYRPPLYPLLLYFVSLGQPITPWGVGVFHLLLGVATTGCSYFLAKSWKLGNRSWLAACLVACDPILLRQSTQVMTETLATLCAVICLLCLARAGARGKPVDTILTGVVLGLACLCRTSFLAYVCLVFPVLVCCSSKRDRWKILLEFSLGFCLVLAPWTVRNMVCFGRPVFATTHGGYTLRLGNNPAYYEFLRQRRWGQTWDVADTLPDHRSAASEIHFDRNNYRAAWQCIRQQPANAAHACLVRLGSLWSLVPHPLQNPEPLGERIARYTVGIWYLAVYSLILVGLRNPGHPIRRSTWHWGLLLCLSLTAVHCFYWSNMRMRAPLMPVLALLAVPGIESALLGRNSPERSRPVT